MTAMTNDATVTPACGEDGFLQHISVLRDANLITPTAWLDEVKGHRDVLEATSDPPDLQPVIDFLIDELDAHELPPDTYRDPNAALCRYPGHRGTDWVHHGGRTICGTCHPRADE